MFRLWVTIVILQLLLTIGVVFAEEHDVCKSEQKYSQIWYINGCDGETLEIKKVKVVDKNKDNPWKGYPYNSGEIPQDATPDNKILKHYLKKYISYGKPSEMNRVVIKIKKDK